jgi:hypothetical protein
MTNETLDLGNNESASRGVFTNTDGTFTAMTLTQSKDFKTLAGANKWFAKNAPSED